ncbi:LysR family transcriptional regulator [Pseudoxanthomonas sp. X-1]|uniref:LysR family transcriptional regulator n=1 Tax=Pseudoxanthomonas sp. X-1 TaxID=2571115 RepID=UPI00110BAB72|nr:LysR family transcriptional regulator [Pseudoxanthomonas sp. X-1]TMN19679.1 LysR family transcriptional regulator [Pseudoxanthomonas sp. X-1]UAY74326.1 LysR family transcriptional regulator [Pseudoxanthomonas sp. X-1]
MRGSEFAELKAFVAVVDRTSFARAADHLGVSRSALSQTIRQLESRLGVRLLNRTTRSVSPTEPGRRLHERVAPMLRDMDQAVAQAVGTRARAAGTLRINTLSMAVERLIAPRLGRFAAAHPEVVLDIVIDDGLSDIAGEGFDAGIRVGGRLQKDMVAVRLTPDFELLAVASPDYLARRGEPRTPADLSRHDCINWRFPGSGKIAGWPFRKKDKTIEYFGEGKVISNHQDIIVPAALQGLGILYAYNDGGIADALAEGRLKRVLADWSPTVPGLFLYYSSRRHMLPALRAFIDCLLDRDIAVAEPPTSKKRR